MSRKVVVIDPNIGNPGPINNRHRGLKLPPYIGNRHWRDAYKDYKDRHRIKNGPTYWRNTFIGVLLPFLVIGMPLQVIIPSANSKRFKRDEQNGEQWVHFRWRSILTRVMTLLLLPPWVYLNYLFGSSSVLVVEEVVIYGTPDIEVLDALFELIYLLPFVLMVNYAWLYGHQLNLYLEALDAPTVVEIQVQPPYSNANEDHGAYQHKEDEEDVPKRHMKRLVVEATSKHKSYRGVLLRAYIIICAIHVLHYFTVQHRIEGDHWTSDRIWAYGMLYAKTVGYTLIYPVYMTLCGGIGCQLDALSGFIQDSIARGSLMTRQSMYLIKKSYEKVADVIVRGNRVFSIFLPIVTIVFILSKALNSSLADSSSSAMKYLGMFLMEVLLPELRAFIGEVSAAASGNSSDTSVKPQETPKESVKPEDIRYYVGVAAQIGLCVYLLWMTFSEAVKANDKARYLQVWLNDFASETSAPCHTQMPGQRSTLVDWELNEYLYREFSFLKLYVHSRMEVHAEYQRALLGIRGLRMISSALANRLNGYHLMH